MSGPFVTPVAKAIPFDNSTNGFSSSDAQAAIEEANNTALASVSPGFTWGRSGNTPSNTYLLNDSVPSNTTGRISPISGYIDRVFVSNELPNTFTVEIQKRSGASFVTLCSISLTAERTKVQSYTNVMVTELDEIAARVSSGSCKNVVVGLVIKGSST